MIEHALRLKPGQDLKKALTEFVVERKMTAAWVMTGIGSLRQTNIRYANQDDGKTETGFFEILSLSGTLSIHGSHLHICVADGEGRCFGGHLLEGNIIYTTAEIVIGESKDMIFTREKDGTTGWAELQIGTGGTGSPGSPGNSGRPGNASRPGNTGSPGNTSNTGNTGSPRKTGNPEKTGNTGKTGRPGKTSNTGKTGRPGKTEG